MHTQKEIADWYRRYMAGDKTSEIARSAKTYKNTLWRAEALSG